MTEAEHKDDPFAINKIHAEKIIKEELYEKIHQDDTENQPNLWKALIEDNEEEEEPENNVLGEKEKENINITVVPEVETKSNKVEKIKSPVKFPALNDQENEPQGSKKSKKKTQKMPLVSNENVPSWRRELEKMYQ